MRSAIARSSVRHTHSSKKLQQDKAFDLMRQKNYSEAISAFQNIEPKDLHDHLGIVRCLIRLHKFDDAKSLLATLSSKIKNERDEAIYYSTLANLHCQLGDFVDAEQALQKISNQKHPFVYYAWIRYYSATKEFDLAISKCEESENLFSDHYHTLFTHAILLAYENSISHLKSAEQILLPFTRKYDDVHSNFSRLTKRSYAQSQVILCFLYLRLDDSAKAFTYANNAIRSDDQYALGYTALAKCYQSTGKQDDKLKASTNFQKSKELDSIRFNLAHGEVKQPQPAVSFAEDESNHSELDCQLQKLFCLKTDTVIKRLNIKDSWGDEDKCPKPKLLKNKLWEDEDLPAVQTTKTLKKKAWDDGLSNSKTKPSFNSQSSYATLANVSDDEDSEVEEDISTVEIAETLKTQKHNANVLIATPILPELTPSLSTTSHIKTATPLPSQEVKHFKNEFPISEDKKKLKSVSSRAFIEISHIEDDATTDLENASLSDFESKPRRASCCITTQRTIHAVIKSIGNFMRDTRRDMKSTFEAENVDLDEANSAKTNKYIR